MKAMPPTTGHLQLIQFAKHLSPAGVTVLIDTIPAEPMVPERIAALKKATYRLGNVHIQHVSQWLPEDPESEGFRELWRGILIGAGARPGDYLVTSEPYGKWLAELTETIWMPYDIPRFINGTRATAIRDDFVSNWRAILPEFRPHLQTRVTIFGAESTGKTDLSWMLADDLDATWLPEWARPYLENDENIVNVRTMTNIWHGQAALQRQEFLDTPIIIQDTDLLSTWGYWKYWAHHYDSFEPFARPRLTEWVPQALDDEARELASDLYIVTPSNIPFEPDPLRYGGDKREIDDHYWGNFLARVGASGRSINYQFLTSESRSDRLVEAKGFIQRVIDQKQAKIAYKR